MKLKLRHAYFIMISLISCSFYAQDISLYKQYNGNFDFIFIGNTLNTIENNSIEGQPAPPCTILTSSSAALNLNKNDKILNAYLYWAGSGSGDFNVKLNGTEITSSRNFNIQNQFGYEYFSAFADITTLVKNSGNGVYNLSDLDLTDVISNYCSFGGNFGGWAILIVYGNDDLPLNQLNIYDGMQGIPNVINITLNDLNVIDNKDAKIGFIAWEGDKNIAVNESLRVNGYIIENLPLNPSDNAFNGTNSFTNSDTLYNMDLDVYDIQNSIKIGDKSAQIQLTSGQDFVMINVIVTKLNSQLTDATIKIDNENLTCNSRQIGVDYTVSNFNSNNQLPAGTPIAIYANDILVQQTQTKNNIPVNGSESASILIEIPDTIPNDFELKFVVDDDGTGQGIVSEIDETNNSDTNIISLWLSPEYNLLENLTSCNEGFGKGSFNFSNYTELVKVNPDDKVAFFDSLVDAETGTNPIYNTSNYITTTPKTIYVRIENVNCFSITSFLLITKNCPPIVYNYVSANDDKINDTFNIEGLRNIFLNYKLSIYNRWGILIWEGNQNIPDWNGYSTQGKKIGSGMVPDGTYFYILDLNDPDYKKPIMGYLYFIK